LARFSAKSRELIAMVDIEEIMQRAVTAAAVFSQYDQTKVD
jgi:hypothetical protein